MALTVSTPGWFRGRLPGGVQGTGLEVLTDVLQAIRPSHVVMLQTDSARKNLPSHPFWIQDHSGTRPAPQLFLLPSSTRAVAGDDEASISQATPDGEHALSSPCRRGRAIGQQASIEVPRQQQMVN